MILREMCMIAIFSHVTIEINIFHGSYFISFKWCISSYIFMIFIDVKLIIVFFHFIPYFHHYANDFQFPSFIFIISNEFFSSSWSFILIINFFHHSLYFYVFIILIKRSSFLLIVLNIILMLSSFILRISTLLFSSWSCMLILSWLIILKWCLIAAMLNNSNSTSTRPSTGMFHIAINRSD